MSTLLSDSGFRRAFQTVRQLQRERRLLLGTGAAALRRELSAELDRRLVLAQERAGRAVQGILTRALQQLREYRMAARQLLFDLEGRAASNDKTADCAQEPVAEGRQQRWRFTGEFWADEVGHYSVDISCR